MSKPETLPEIAERLTDAISPSSACHEEDRASDYAEILAALGEVEKRGEQRAAKLGGALLDSAVERAEKAEADLRDIIENDEGQRERANKLEAEVARLREALSGLLESPASFEDSRLDYAERQVDTKAWDEAKAALAAPVEEPKP
jgi:chromosome segregation ATPase